MERLRELGKEGRRGRKRERGGIAAVGQTLEMIGKTRSVSSDK